MKVVHTEGELLAALLNFERGRLVFQAEEDGTVGKLPPPHSPATLFSVPPPDQEGVAVDIEFRPHVVVVYTHNVRETKQRITRLLRTMEKSPARLKPSLYLSGYARWGDVGSWNYAMLQEADYILVHSETYFDSRRSFNSFTVIFAPYWGLLTVSLQAAAGTSRVRADQLFALYAGGVLYDPDWQLRRPERWTTQPLLRLEPGDFKPPDQSWPKESNAAAARAR